MMCNEYVEYNIVNNIIFNIKYTKKHLIFFNIKKIYKLYYLFIILYTNNIIMLPYVHVLLIEADNQRNLGGSCIRDIVNMDKYVCDFSSNKYKKRTNICIVY